MPIPDLTEKGLLPIGIHDCSFGDIEKQFAFNSSRKVLWDSFIQALMEIKQTFKGSVIFVDGGYTSTKPITSDIDIVLEFSDSTPFKIVQYFVDQKSYFKNKYNVHVNVRIENHPKTLKDTSLYFQYIKTEDKKKLKLPPDAKKGILKVIL
jgi:hypothetical protein